MPVYHVIAGQREYHFLLEKDFAFKLSECIYPNRSWPIVSASKSLVNNMEIRTPISYAVNENLQILMDDKPNFESRCKLKWFEWNIECVIFEESGRLCLQRRQAMTSVWSANQRIEYVNTMILLWAQTRVSCTLPWFSVKLVQTVREVGKHCILCHCCPCDFKVLYLKMPWLYRWMERQYCIDLVRSMKNRNLCLPRLACHFVCHCCIVLFDQILQRIIIVESVRVDNFLFHDKSSSINSVGASIAWIACIFALVFGSSVMSLMNACS